MEKFNRSEQNEYLILFGWPGDIPLVMPEVNFDFKILDQGAYFMIIRRSISKAD